MQRIGLLRFICLFGSINVRLTMDIGEIKVTGNFTHTLQASVKTTQQRNKKIEIEHLKKWKKLI